jgi:hypothetical protein
MRHGESGVPLDGRNIERVCGCLEDTHAAEESALEIWLTSLDAASVDR